MVRIPIFPKRSGIRAAILTVAVVSGVVAACHSSSPTAPKAGSGPNPPIGSIPILTGLAIAAPSSIAPGESVQFTVTVTRSDGSVENVSAQTTWSSSNSKVLEVGPTGLARGVAVGDASIFARYQNRSTA